MILNDRNYIAKKLPSVKYGALANEIEEFARGLYPQFIPEFMKKTLFEMNAGRMINLDLQLETGPGGRITKNTISFINHYNFQTESACQILTVLYETFCSESSLFITFFLDINSNQTRAIRIYNSINTSFPIVRSKQDVIFSTMPFREEGNSILKQ